MLKRTWVLIALVYLAFAEFLSWMPVPDLALCLIQPEHSQQSSNHDDKKYCAAFHTGVIAFLDAIDGFLEHHDKSVVGGFTIVLAISTIGLWLATNKLWAAGERQFELLSESAASQSRDMKESTTVGRTAAEAALKSADAAHAVVYDNRENLEISRAQVRAHFLCSLKAKITPDRKQVVEFTCRNTGQSQAGPIQVAITFGYLRLSGGIPQTLANPQTVTFGGLAPNESLTDIVISDIPLPDFLFGGSLGGTR
jgi:hypothetical protein